MEFASFYGNGAVPPQLPRRHTPAGHERRGRVIAAGAGRRIAVVVAIVVVGSAVAVVRVRIGVIGISAIGIAPIVSRPIVPFLLAAAGWRMNDLATAPYLDLKAAKGGIPFRRKSFHKF
jgi:hypothetical protein